ncbi:serine aminopeptidase domain-containing protein [Frankia sp. ACN1ag]|uniref:serine aminopeptidase domain-containing protein n=1 Tax=Frankia sp. ACN1ag TaxID=102891 RepID=UPI0006DCE28C|nr:alpha/beta hydrolase [Frankia sp. ACN1ag]KQC37666.1 lysophospholipase [Frankia sp. ACN1ag]
MTSAQLSPAPASTIAAWDNPPAVAPRGTIILVVGRGEHPGVYERFGTRIAFDGYRVRVVGDPTADADAVTADIRTLLSDPDLPAPRVLAGSDAGAAFVAALAATGTVQADALLLVGLPPATAGAPAPAGPASAAAATSVAVGATEAGATEAGAIGAEGAAAGGEDADGEGRWAAELAARTACPTHQARLSADPHLRRGGLDTPVPPAWLADGDLGRVDLPVLGLHGTADLVSPLGQVRARYAAAPRAELVTIDGGKHDALNDATHRTAAAAVVLFLERLRLGSELPAIARWS